MKQLDQYASQFGVTPSTPKEKKAQVANLLRDTLISLQADMKQDSMTAAQLEAQLEVQKQNQKIIQQVTDEIVTKLERQTQAMRDAYQDIANKVNNLTLTVQNPIDDKAFSKYAESLKKSVVESVKANDSNMKDIKSALKTIKLPALPKMPDISIPEPVTEWEFEFIRNDKGFTDKIVAKAIR